MISFLKDLAICFGIIFGIIALCILAGGVMAIYALPLGQLVIDCFLILCLTAFVVFVIQQMTKISDTWDKLI
jgi:hypothetical protein